MAQFVKHTGSGIVNAVEFSPIAGQPHAFFTLAPGASTQSLEALLKNPPINHHVLSVTPNTDSTLLVTRGPASPQDILAMLNAHGEALAPPTPIKKSFNPWAWRGITSIVGQSLQIASSVKGNGSAADRNAVFGFAALNLTANFINILFGAQKKSDPHQLRALKEQANEQLEPYVATGSLPDPNFIVSTRNGKATTEHGTGAFLQKHSVSFGEIGLRTLGSISLSFPVARWKSAFSILRETGSISNAFKTMRNPNPVTFGAGLVMILGKLTSMAATEPDPYNPEPPTMLDRFRQKIAFRLSSVIDGGASAWMAHDRINTQKIKLGGKEMPDYFGAAGNAVFFGGYGIRLAAPYGTREVNMPELYAHVAEGLAKTSATDLPALTAQMAAQLKQHFHDKPVSVGEIYSALAHELSSKHHIAISSQPHSTLATKAADSATPNPQSHIEGGSYVNAQRMLTTMPAVATHIT